MQNAERIHMEADYPTPATWELRYLRNMCPGYSTPLNILSRKYSSIMCVCGLPRLSLMCLCKSRRFINHWLNAIILPALSSEALIWRNGRSTDAEYEEYISSSGWKAGAGAPFVHECPAQLIRHHQTLSAYEYGVWAWIVQPGLPYISMDYSHMLSWSWYELYGLCLFWEWYWAGQSILG